jgi:uncharacterized GH25 family protein
MLAAVLAAIGLQHAAAHDFWIEPSSYHPPAGTPVKVALRVGEEFTGQPIVRDDRTIAKFVLVGPDGESPVRGIDGKDPAGFVRVTKSGLQVLGYRSGRSVLELEARKFEAYLADEGQQRVIALRKERGQTESPGREAFSRCAKALLIVGQGNSEGFDRVLGFTLEVVPETNPDTYKVGDAFAVRLLYHDKPLENALIVATSRTAPKQKQALRSGPDGRVVFHLDRGGIWLINAVHMVEAPAEVDAQWESFWASLTLELPGAAQE